MIEIEPLEPRRHLSIMLPRADHVVVVVEENKNYDQVRTAPYIASLIAGGSSFSNFHAISHPSQPNYIAMWSGSTQGVTDDRCPPPGTGLFAAGECCRARGGCAAAPGRPGAGPDRPRRRSCRTVRWSLRSSLRVHPRRLNAAGREARRSQW